MPKSVGVLLGSILIALFGVWAYRSLPSFREKGLSNPKPQTSATPAPTPIPSLTLDRIYASDHSWIRGLPKEKTVTMIATGDVIPARSVNYKMVTGKGFRWPFEKTADVLRSADLTVINLETPIFSGCVPTVEGMRFCGDQGVTEGLAYAGIDVATLGNNHAGNYGREGVEETVRLLERAGILPVGVGTRYKTMKGVRFAFLSYDDIGPRVDGVPWADEQTIRREIAEARKNADVVIAAYHWGVEYVTQPSSRQRELGYVAIDAGADLVLGNHPHWIQPVELYKDTLIAYAHGNFVFDQEWSEETKRGVVGRYVFYEGKLVDVEYLPVRIMDYGQPYFLDGASKGVVLDSMYQASTVLQSSLPSR